jgi:hypothetical protein
MPKSCKFYKEQEYISYDYGATWVATSNYRMGDLIERRSTDCGYAEEYRWVNSSRVECTGVTQVYSYIKQFRESGDTSATWEYVIPYEYSIDGEGTMPLNVKEYKSQACGYRSEWRVVEGFICDESTHEEYEKLQLYESEDYGATFAPAYPPQYQRGNLITSGCGLNCAVEKWVYTVEDVPKPLIYSGKSVSCGSAYTAATMPEGYAKSIQFIDGIHICSVEKISTGCRVTRDWASAWKFSNIGGTSSLTLGDTEIANHDYCNGGCVNFYSHILDGAGVDTDCYCCCQSHKTCPAWIITEYMPWLEERSYVKAIYREKYERTSSQDAWTAVPDSKEFYKEAEQWVAVEETSTTKTFQHKVASINECGVITWTNEGNLIPYTKSS